jgi:hypothetical protein
MKNKLVIIGNGFDLAHGLKTKYAHFLKAYLSKIVKEQILSPFYSEIYSNEVSDVSILLHGLNSSHKSISELFKEILKQYNENKESRWVDIEAVYFSILTKYYNEYIKDINSSHLQIKNDDELKSTFKYKVEKLNIDFEIIKTELIDYLNTITFENNVYREDFIPLFRDVLCSKIADNNSESLFLNFNYTTSLNLYKELIDKKGNNILHIHGKLIDKTNPIIFGYGDEMNPYHQKIVDLNINELFAHFKSFKYAQTENYHNLLLFLQKPYDVYILGHSCGLSDRVLFSTIFNDINCEKIYPFYHEYEKGKDDFTEKTYELSRHFNKTSDFRKKVQPKTKCERI